MKTARFAFLAVAICGLSLSLTNAVPTSKIWGGNDRPSGEAPWVGSVRVGNVHTCSCSIISPTHVLTAGHCVSAMGTNPVPVSTVTVRVGSINQFAGGEIVNVLEIVIHPAYANFLNNMAILTLSRSLNWSTKISSIPIAESEDDAPADAIVTVDGWGLQEGNQSPYKLQKLEAKIVARHECEYECGYGYQSVLCMSTPVGKGICTGDAGAGVVKDGKLVGVASFAFGSCASDYPDVASKVSYYLPWIKSEIA